VRDYATKLNDALEMAAKAGMAEMSEIERAKGARV
jgi:hypothetical protein